jgi:hypothetical protein
MTMALSGCATGFPTGAGTATITWHGISGAPLTRPQPYSGTIAGVPVSGDSRSPLPQLPGGHFPPRLVLARWTGSFQGETFDITVSVKTAGLANNPSAAADIGGTLGSEPVTGTARASPSHPNILHFVATIGHHHVTGTIQPFNHGSTGKATATFTVTGWETNSPTLLVHLGRLTVGLINPRNPGRRYMSGVKLFPRPLRQNAGGRADATRPPEPPYAQPTRLHQREGQHFDLYPLGPVLIRGPTREWFHKERVLTA